MYKGLLFLCLLSLIGCSQQAAQSPQTTAQPSAATSTTPVKASPQAKAQTATARKPAAVKAKTPDQYWNMRKQNLARSQQWTLNGRASVTYRSENWPFNVVWKQVSANAYTMNILNPITRSQMATVTKNLGGVTLRMRDGKTYRDSSAEKLVAKHLNIQVPIDGMQHWARGLPTPLYRVDNVKLDGKGRPTLLSQAGWSINLSRYAGADYNALPSLITVQRNKPEYIRVKMLAKRWQ